jgi:hypothetical protein
MRVELDNDYDVKTLRRLLSKIEHDPESDCWCFTGGKTPNGYGMSSYRGKRVYAHRLSYELFTGPIPDGLVLDHVRNRGCHHRSCINPRHLEAVSQATNLHRGQCTLASINAAKTHCPYGHAYTEANTFLDSKSGRNCRECRRQRRNRKRKEAKTNG